MKSQIKLVVFTLFQITIISGINSQNLYKTPSGEKYHIGSCRMVESVSSMISIDQAKQYGLTPCKICNPPKIQTYSSGYSKAKGKKKTEQCIGTTKRGTRCQHMTSIGGGYCYQHTKQNSSAHSRTYQSTYRSASRTNRSTSSTSSLCGATTKSGRACRRKVKGGGRCYQH